VRAAIAPAALMPAVKSAFAQEHPRISLKLTTLEQQVAGSIHLERAMGLLAGFFGAMALALAALGLYGLVSYTVARRRSEIGVRIALGAARSQIVRMVFGDVGRLVGAGIAIGVPLAVAVSRIVASLLYGVTPGDPVMLGLSALALTAVAIGAALLPARRAACLDPMAALRED
jgi:putative ABC transport system permease protein